MWLQRPSQRVARKGYEEHMVFQDMTTASAETAVGYLVPRTATYIDKKTGGVFGRSMS